MVFKVVGQMMGIIGDWSSSVVVMLVLFNSVIIRTYLCFSRTYSYLFLHCNI